jgi:hypothetical protein
MASIVDVRISTIRVRKVTAALALLAAFGLGLVATSSAKAQSLADGYYPYAQSRQTNGLDQVYGWTHVFATLPARGVKFGELDTQTKTASTIPFFTASITSPLDGNTYTYQIAGADPNTSKTTTYIAYVPIVARIHFADGTVLDPTLPGCGDTVSVANRFYNGPNFASTSYTSNGVSVGTTQFTDAFQRAEFWSIVGGTRYHTLLQAAAQPRVLDVNAPPGSFTVAGVCAGSSHRIGEIPFNAYDAIIQSIATTYATPTQVPVVLSYNVFETFDGHCCIIGYHSAIGTSTGTTVYAVGAYNDAGIFSVPIEDINAWTHELGELFNDPFVNNATPAWGHVGQVSGCQNNLEVGDPLTGTVFTLTFNGFTYHPQELAFFSWFFRESPSEGTGGLYSFKGTFTTTQGPCT